ncbi:MAG TPA: type I glyceraldehyde-3-phosphate dehydrogenase [Bacillota bacterium]|jgi:glyceraldehyde 3-phosphate dehydrogenase|nr:type I glyceraldehyde-3-phosphate dehydrogenase [Bacillota bacterium]HOA34709.1 type I glyceraldehyde-3-phosphate dehydrogenase [Bacillota bacterium]HOJ83912.1 type I glyceraldehyde-3-phosphate dehydrogenase [Bacillota bacterium]HOL15890.1 type I glyceraldehyde-3-phosphate dehydrogenase [Bacillota bacterium]HPZ11176.1 type I glyceraldehyde-3-phosphate dehydrogenase [Bacillota bacterium]
MLKVGINGFGRIGRLTMRASLGQDQIKIVAVNDLVDSATLAHLLQYDSIYGKLDVPVKAEADGLLVGGEYVRVFSERDPGQIPWKEYGVDLVVESTGRFRTRDAASAHLKGGARRVIITAPAEADIMIVLGVNEERFNPQEHFLISNASCTTNALAPVVKVLHDKFGVRKGLMNTTHSYTNDQVILDLPHPDLRRARAAALSMIPTSTGAAKAVGLVLPELKGKIDGFAVRVPTPTVSLVDLVAELEQEVTPAKVNEAFKEAAAGSKYLAFSDTPLVSSDYKGNPYSSTVDGLSTMVVGENLVRVVAWYDNEWAYSCRVADLAAFIAGRE